MAPLDIHMSLIDYSFIVAGMLPIYIINVYEDDTFTILNKPPVLTG